MIDCGEVSPEDYEERINKLKKELATLQNKKGWTAYFKRKFNRLDEWMNSLEHSDKESDHMLFVGVIITLTITLAPIALLALYLSKGSIILIPMIYVFYKIYQNIKD